jgi:hypothetical protein
MKRSGTRLEARERDLGREALGALSTTESVRCVPHHLMVGIGRVSICDTSRPSPKYHASVAADLPEVIELAEQSPRHALSIAEKLGFCRFRDREHSRVLDSLFDRHGIEPFAKGVVTPDNGDAVHPFDV